MSNIDRTGCEARQYSDQMQCDRCGHMWDTNDDDAPECLTDDEVSRERIINRITRIKGTLGL